MEKFPDCPKYGQESIAGFQSSTRCKYGWEARMRYSQIRNLAKPTRHCFRWWSVSITRSSPSAFHLVPRLFPPCSNPRKKRRRKWKTTGEGNAERKGSYLAAICNGQFPISCLVRSLACSLVPPLFQALFHFLCPHRRQGSTADLPRFNSHLFFYLGANQEITLTRLLRF